ncbi:thiol-activated cytolysin family protein [Deinococcus malanensis]
MTASVHSWGGAQVRPLPVQPVQPVRPAPTIVQPLRPLPIARPMTLRQLDQLPRAELMNMITQAQIQFTQIPRRTFIIPVIASPITKVGAPVNVVQNTPGGPMACSVQRYSLRAAPPEHAMKTLDQDKLWVGSLVRTAGLELGSMTAINIPEERRHPYRITSTLPVVSGSATIQPHQTAYNLAVAGVRQGMVGNPFGSTVRYERTEQSSAETSALKLGLKAGGIGYSVKAAGSYSTENRQNRVSAVFVQNAFTMNADLGGRTAAEAFLKSPTAEDLAAVTGPSASAAYIDSITYGRLLFVEMTSSYTSQQMKAALDASYSGASASVQAEAEKVLSDSRFNVYAAGGNEQAIVDLIRTQKLAQYFQNTSDPRTLVPISFTARNFMDGTYAASSSTGEFAESVCNPNSVKATVRVSYRSIEPEDNRYDDVYGEVAVNGTQIWRLGSGDRVDLYKGQTLNLNGLSSPLTLNYGETRTMTLVGRLMDWDMTGDDVIGMWNEVIDLRAVAEELRSTDLVRREFRKRGSDDADGVMIVEFIRNN